MFNRMNEIAGGYFLFYLSIISDSIHIFEKVLLNWQNREKSKYWVNKSTILKSTKISWEDEEYTYR